MKIVSEKTGKEYNSVELCLADEKAYDERIAQEKAKKEAASKVEEKRQALIAAQKAFQEELTKFCNKYGAYHYTVKNGDESWFNLFDNFFKNFWF